jgi:hypothetical protein
MPNENNTVNLSILQNFIKIINPTTPFQHDKALQKRKYLLRFITFLQYPPRTAQYKAQQETAQLVKYDQPGKLSPRGTSPPYSFT